MNFLNQHNNKLTSFFCLLLLFILIPQTNAGWGFDTSYKYGAIYVRDFVLGDNNKPIYVVYDSESGKELDVIGEAVGSLEKAKVVSGDYYNAWIDQYDKLMDANPDFELINKDSFDPASFKTVTDETITNVPSLKSDTLFVLVKGASQRFSTDGSTLIQLELPINPENRIKSSTKSLLLLENGTVYFETDQNIGFRVAFYGTAEDPYGTGLRQNTDTIYGPLQGVGVDVVGALGAGATDEEGKYAFPVILPPCPGFIYTYSTNATAEIYFRRFSPRGSHAHPYYMTRYGYDVCNGLAALLRNSTSLTGLMAAVNIASYSSTYSQPKTDFLVDIMVLSGKATIQNPDGTSVQVTQQTVYNHEQQPFEREAQQHYDLDGDGTDDVSYLGKIQTNQEGKKEFVRMAATANPEIQGVWLSSIQGTSTISLGVGSTTESLPDLTRIPDWKPDFQDRALVSEISELDFRNTDLYVFRESNGAIVAERKGIKPEEVIKPYDGAGVFEGKYFYNMMIMGAREYNYLKGTKQFEQWQEKSGILDENLYNRNADHLRPGEAVRLIAINRATGYIGTLRTQLQPSGSLTSTLISFPIEDLKMAPPNLKIWAERYTKVKHGLTKDEDRDYQIGNEGAGLADDKKIVIYTEWFDKDDTPLPNTLTKEYTYTGRLAQVVSGYKLQTVTSGIEETANALSHFSIRPGRNIQVVRLPDKVAGKQHLYVQVHAEPATLNPDFGSSAIHQGILKHRPDKYVPFMVPLYDENETNLFKQAYQKALDANPNNTDLEKPEPFYQWVYRPEFQFSVYDLKIDSIRRGALDAEDSDLDTVLSLSPEEDAPVVTNNDELVKIFYNLTTTEYNPLEAWAYDGSKELVFVFGEEEIKATLGEGKEITFDNLDQLDKLDTEDFMSIRLYANNDTANILWEYAFTNIKIAVDLNRDGKVKYDYEMYEKDDAGVEDLNKPTDMTTKDRPFRFWVNNDYDVVNNGGSIDLDIYSCQDLETNTNTNLQSDDNPQVCEEWDEDPKDNTNTSDDMLMKIESFRDLEDFFPLAIKLGHNEITDNYVVKLKAFGVNINLFKGAWKDNDNYKAHDYIHKHTFTEMQMLAAEYSDSPEERGHIKTLRHNESLILSQKDISRLFDNKGVGRFIVEGVSKNETLCVDHYDRCYLSVALYKSNDPEPLSEAKVYLDLHNVKDFYQHVTAGHASDSGGDFDAQYFGSDAITETHEVKLNIFDGLFKGDVVNNDALRKNYILLVHGWRMEEPEKISFAETAYKRLYWSGYTGTFGTFSWPTGWFNKPAHDYSDIGNIYRVVLQANLANYDRSESVARRVGRDLSTRISMFKDASSSVIPQERHVIAHSMGNVLISETLRNSPANSLLFESYTASEAATVAGAYDKTEESLQSHSLLTAQCLLTSIGLDEEVSFETAWRCYNIDNDSDYDIPPDIYRYDLVAKDQNGQLALDDNGNLIIQHGPTSDAKMSESNKGSHYYSGIKNKVGRIINLFNSSDAALSAWELNQFNRPNAGWSYGNEMTDYLDALSDYNFCVASSNNGGLSCIAPTPYTNEIVNSRFFDSGVFTTTEIHWTIPTTENSANILSNIVPGRTRALGQTSSSGEISAERNYDLLLTNSNQDHSAQFHGYYSEIRPGNRAVRARYWNIILSQSLELSKVPELYQYSGLRNTVGIE